VRGSSRRNRQRSKPAGRRAKHSNCAATKVKKIQEGKKEQQKPKKKFSVDRTIIRRAGKNFLLHICRGNVAQKIKLTRILFLCRPARTAAAPDSASGTEQPLTEHSKQNRFRPLKVKNKGKTK
jgi:hypothetical protein